MAAVDHVGEHRGRLRQRIDQRRPLGSGLLVLQRSRHEDGDLHLRRPVGHGAAVEERGVTPGARARRNLLRAHEAGEVLGLVVQRLVGQAGRRRPRGAGGELGVDLVVGPGLADARDRGRRALGHGAAVIEGGRLCVVDPRVDPVGGEPVVEDAARVPGREEVVGRAHRGDGGEPRRVGAGRRELGEAREADADHADLVVRHPRLVRDDLHRVVGVVVGGVAEEVEGASRAARSPHLEADGGEAGEAGDDGPDVGGAVRQEVGVPTVRARHAEDAVDQRRNRVRRPGDVVARVLHHRGAGAGRRAGPAVGVAHRGRQLDAVTHRDVVEPLVHRLVGVEGRIGPGVGARRQDRERRGPLAGRGIEPGVARTRPQVPDDERAERPGHAGVRRVLDGGVVLQERDLVPGVGTGQPGLLDRAVAPQRAVVHGDRQAGARPAHAVGIGGDALQDVGAVGDRGRVPAADPSEQARAGPRDHPVAHRATREDEDDLGDGGRRRTGVEILDAGLGRPVRGEEHGRRRWRVVHVGAGAGGGGGGGGGGGWERARPGDGQHLRHPRQAGDREQAHDGAAPKTAQRMRPSSTDLRTSPHANTLPESMRPSSALPLSPRYSMRTDVTPRPSRRPVRDRRRGAVHSR